jgi:hypothetical protein
MKLFQKEISDFTLNGFLRSQALLFKVQTASVPLGFFKLEPQQAIGTFYNFINSNIPGVLWTLL